MGRKTYTTTSNQLFVASRKSSLGSWTWWMTYSLPNTRTFWIKHWLCWIKLVAVAKTVVITAFYYDLRKTITALNWVKYPDTSMTSKSIIFQSQRLRQRSDLHDNEKLGCFEVTTFSDPWITKLIFITNQSLTTQGSDLTFNFHTRAWLAVKHI